MVFRALGEVRDRQTVIASLAPQLAAAGMPQVPWAPAAAGEDPGHAVRQPAFQAALAALLVHAATARDEDGATTVAPRRLIKRRLKALHQRLCRDARRFPDLPVSEQHRARKRLKRLRYLTEFTQPLFAAGRVGAYLALMRPAQEELGRHNDRAVALSLLDQEALARHQPEAVDAAKWLTTQLDRSGRRSGRALRKLRDAPHFWQKKAKHRQTA